MLTLLAPYILGFLTQVGALIGQHAASPHRGVLTASAGIERAEFALRLDRAQSIPSALVLCTSGLLVAPALSKAVTVVVVAVAILVSFALYVWLQGRDAVQYADLTNTLRGVSVVNLIMMGANMGLGAVVYFTHGSTVT